MAKPTDNGGRAQHSCAQNALATLGLAALAPDVREAIESASTLPGKVRALLAAHSREMPLTLSAAELAEVLKPRPNATAKQRTNDERQVRRALALVRLTYRGRYHERQRSERRITRAPARWIERECQGVVAYASLTDQRSVASTNLTGSTTRARDARRPASRSKSPRRRAVRLELPPVPDVFKSDEVRGSLEAIGKAHGRDALREVLLDLRRLAVREQPDAALLALRTLPLRRPRKSPLACFRDLFNRACDGDQLCDTAADAARTVEAELELLTPADGEPLPADYRELDPATYWPDWKPPPGAEPIPFVELIARPVPLPAPVLTCEDRARARARRVRLAGLDPPPRPRDNADADATARFLKSVKPIAREPPS